MDEVASPPPERDPNDLREVRNDIDAFQYGLARLRELPLCCASSVSSMSA